jgi:hypothetical protein
MAYTEDSTTMDDINKSPMAYEKPGQRFHMDMGFVRGTKFSHRDNDGNLVTSIDGYNSYLLIIDKATRYTWVFLAKTKTPPISTITGFLKTHGTKENVIKHIRTDEGGELWGCHAFQHAVKDAGYCSTRRLSSTTRRLCLW